MANNLRRLRKAAGLTVTAAAARMGTTDNQLGKLERGERRLSDVWIARAAKAYGVDPGALVSEEEEAKPTLPPAKSNEDRIRSDNSDPDEIISLHKSVLVNAIEGAVGHLVHMNPNALRSFAESVIELATTLQPRIADVDMTDSIRTAAATVASQFSGQRSQGNNQR